MTSWTRPGAQKMTLVVRSLSARSTRERAGVETQMMRETIARKNAITILMTTIIVAVRIKVAVKRNVDASKKSQRPAKTTRNLETAKSHAKNAMRS
jgi:hypothetical protein